MTRRSGRGDRPTERRSRLRLALLAAAAVAIGIAAAWGIGLRSRSAAYAAGSRGMASHADLHYDDAVREYRLASDLDPDNWRWQYYRALVHLERGEASEAADALRAVVIAQPELGIAWWRLGETAFKRSRYDDAEAAYVRAEQTSPRTGYHPDVGAYARVGRARVALHKGDTPTARDLLATVVEAEPRFGAAHRVLADVLRAQGRHAEAERQAARATALPAYAAPHDPLLDVLVERSRNSVFLLRQASSIDLARDPGRRERLVQRALDAHPDDPDVVYEMGSFLQRAGRPADALPFLTRHLEMVEDDQQTLVQIGKSYSDLGRLEEAETTLRRALDLGDDAIGFYNLGVVLEQRERSSDAEASYRRAVEAGPGLAGARNNLGALLARRGRLAEATAHLMEAIRLAPASADAYTNLSAVLLQQGALTDAVSYARLALDIDPRRADAHVNLGVAVARLGDLEQARQHFDEALRINPRHEGARTNREALSR